MDMNAIGAELMQRRAITSYRLPEVAQMSRIISWLRVRDATSAGKTRCQMNSFSLNAQRLPIF
jgi:hypothetical protein